MRIYDIEWDTDDVVDKFGLPTEVTITDSKEIKEMLYNSDYYIADYLSDKYGYCVKSFEVDNESGKNNNLWNLLKSHYGHKVEIAVYGDVDNPANISLEDIDTNEVILDAELYSICESEDRLKVLLSNAIELLEEHLTTEEILSELGMSETEYSEVIE